MPYKDKNKQLAYQRTRYKAHRAELCAQRRGYYKIHLEERRAEARNRYVTHRDELCARRRANHARHREQDNAYIRVRNAADRLNVFNAYGGPRCVCCSETTNEFLTLDHIGGDGALHRRQIGKQGNSFYRYLKAQGFPPGFRVLCMNCNFALGRFGYCPHGNVKVEPEQAITKNGHLKGGHPDQLTLLAWNFEHEIMSKTRGFPLKYIHPIGPRMVAR